MRMMRWKLRMMVMMMMMIRDDDDDDSWINCVNDYLECYFKICWMILQMRIIDGTSMTKCG